jgi:hypothetical protein
MLPQIDPPQKRAVEIIAQDGRVAFPLRVVTPCPPGARRSHTAIAIRSPTEASFGVPGRLNYNRDESCALRPPSVRHAGLLSSAYYWLDQ